MKFYKTSQDAFEDEGRDAEEDIEVSETIDGQQELDDIAVGKRGPSNTSDVLMEAGKNIGERLEASWVANGSVGWFKYKDGTIYEVSVAPAAHGNYFSYFKELRNRKNLPEGKLDGEDDDLQM